MTTLNTSWFFFKFGSGLYDVVYNNRRTYLNRAADVPNEVAS